MTHPVVQRFHAVCSIGDPSAPSQDDLRGGAQLRIYLRIRLNNRRERKACSLLVCLHHRGSCPGREAVVGIGEWDRRGQRSKGSKWESVSLPIGAAVSLTHITHLRSIRGDDVGDITTVLGIAAGMVSLQTSPVN